MPMLMKPLLGCGSESSHAGSQNQYRGIGRTLLGRALAHVQLGHRMCETVRAAEQNMHMQSPLSRPGPRGPSHTCL
eukprot:4914985-Alexandrium_andersonii.AAC.1